ncbi:MAG: hypothetical protein JWQ66_1559 [Mucilaginibacter sp.]|nr:hypothetical protein [Mucilaginibacter sp.]
MRQLIGFYKRYIVYINQGTIIIEKENDRLIIYRAVGVGLL